MITYEGFAKTFGIVHAVRDLTVTIAAGEVVALLGPNGSGKTTSIKAAAGLVRPTEGRVLLGAPGRSALEADARRVCSFLPQRVTFPESLTGREVAEFYCKLRGRNADRLQEVMKLTGLNGSSRRTVGTYSGGMTQRLGLAVAMAAQALVLLLDEPTAALDPDGTCAFYAVIEARRSEGQTVFFSSHQMGDVERLADRFLVMVSGRLVASFTARELTTALANRGVMKVTVDGISDVVLTRLRAIAPGVMSSADQIMVPGTADVRLAVLDLLRNQGVTIRGWSAEEGRLDAFYRELVEGHHG
ncbi:MAG: ABC transporter ATP-binding protein [Acidimicrobiia bacterium]|nr:ABC transporter ATP-binding protein [Acidimicrobiia bacterium]